MWQRIQTFYLVLAAAGGMVMFFFPFAGFNGYSASYDFTPLGIEQTSGDMNPLPINFFILLLPLIGTVGLTALAAITIFMYKNRKLQARLGKLNILIISLLLALVFLINDQVKIAMENSNDVLVNYGISSVIPIVSIILTWLANRAIRRDEEMVRGSDRIR